MKRRLAKVAGEVTPRLYKAVMRLDWQQELEGYSLLQIRDVLRRLRFINDSFSAAWLRAHLPHNKTKETAERLLAGLVESGIAKANEHVGIAQRGPFVLTDTGISLRAASATKRFARARADKAVAKLLETVAQINADPIFPHDVDWVAVYGSYIRDEPDLGDIDVAVKLEARWTPGSMLDGKKTERELMAEKFEAKYPPPASYYEKGFWRFWPETYTMRLLKTDTAMHIIERGELEPIGCPYRLIFPEIREVAAKPDWSFTRGEVVLKTVAPV